MAYSVFISHAHKDNDICDRYAKQLSGWGLDVWYDRSNMEYAQNITDAINKELKQRTALVVLLTPNAVASKWVGLEVSAYLKLWADEGGSRKIVPVMLQECEPPPLLGLFNYIDATLLGEDGAQRAIARTLGVEPPAPPPAPPEPVPAVTVPHTGLTVTPEQAVQLLASVTRMLDDWAEFTEEKWRAISDSQMGWKPLRGRWNGWDEIYQDFFGAAASNTALATISATRRRYENATQKGSAAAAVACFLCDLDALRQSIGTVYDGGEAADGSASAGPRPRGRTTARLPIARNPMIVDADADDGWGYGAWDEVDLERALVPSRPHARRRTGRQPVTRTPVGPTGKRPAVARTILPPPAPAPTPQPPHRHWRWPWQRAAH